MNVKKQIAMLDETETLINIDYLPREIVIYTNKATVMNRLERMGYKPESEDFLEGEVYSQTYRFPSKEIGKFLRTGIFKFD